MALSVAILVTNWDVYTRPFTDTLQESQASFHAFGFALTNGLLDWRNPFIPRELNCYEGVPREWNSWPNGFFLVLLVAVELFGQSEFVGRITSLVLNLGGLLLLTAAFFRRYPLTAFLLPLTLASSIGRDSLSFVFVDAMVFPIIGAAWFFAVQRSRGVFGSLPIRLVLILGPFFFHLASILLMGPIAWSYLRSRNWRQLAFDGLSWAGGLLTSLLLLSLSRDGLAEGFTRLTSRYLHRANVEMEFIEVVTWTQALTTLRQSLHANVFYLIPWTSILWAGLLVLIIGAWLAVNSRGTLITIVILAGTVVVYFLVLTNYVTVHVFARLPLVVTLTLIGLIGLSQIMRDLAGYAQAPSNRWPMILTIPSVLAVLVISLISLAGIPRSYSIDESVVQLRAELTNYVTKHDLSTYTIFQDTNHEVIDPLELFPRMCQFYFGEQIVRGIREDLPNKVRGVVYE